MDCKTLFWLRNISNPLMKEGSFSHFKYVLVFSMLSISGNGIAQGNSYKENQVISMGGRETLKIVRTKGEGAAQEFELRHYVNNKQVGNTFWLTANGIAMQQNTRRSKPPVSKTATLPVAVKLPVALKSGIDIARNPVSIKKTKETPVGQPVAVQTPVVVQAVVPEKQVATVITEIKDAEPPKKVKKEFVSHNPFLSPQYKGNQTARKQSVDSSKTN
jgi:hypothetical protein